MQNIDLICVGKLNAKYFAEGVAEYQKRLAAFANFRLIELPEEKIEEKNASDLITRFNLFAGDPKGLYSLDSELAARVYSAPSLVLG